MYLKDLTINGFKSFAKKGELEFSSSITAIVGPNGSGKSNVAESFRFVLGEQSPSRMRGKKGEDLIWGGSDQVSRSNRASVKLTLNNQKRVFPLDFDEIILERVVNRDGSNEYLINGSQVRLKEVQELLAAANIGPSGHHIISQGEADRILSSSPKDRKEMIEDALGLKVYQFKKVEAEKKLKKTRDNIEKVQSLRREVAPHLHFLEKQIKKIEKATELKENLRLTYAEYLKREDIFLSSEQDNIKKQISPLQENLDKLGKALEVAKSILESQKQDEKRDALVRAEKQLSDSRKHRQDLLREIGVIEGQMLFIDRRRSETQQNNLKNTTISYSEVEKIVSIIEGETNKATQLESVDLLRRSLQDIVRTLKQFLLKTNKDVDTTDEDEYQRLTEQKNALDHSLALAVQQEKTAEGAYNEVRIAIESDQAQSRDAEREVFKIVSDRRESETILTRLEYELGANQRDREEFKRELQEAVALLGRSATDYLNFDIKINGHTITKHDISTENREKQRDRRRNLEKLKIRLEELGGSNDDIEKEYKSVKERDDFLVREITDLNDSANKLEELITDLNSQLDERFGHGIDKINAEFNRFFALMFGGGTAGLNKVKINKRKKGKADSNLGDDEDNATETTDEQEEGIEIDVKLPNKRVKGLDMLSGGERALTSIALIFAMSQVNPPLFIILDETDAALDEANSRRYGDMIEALSQKSQLILITHNRETMSRASILYGVTMSGDGVSKLLSVRLDEAIAVAK